MPCFHATPLLSYGEDFPTWEVVLPGTTGGGVEAIRAGRSVHVEDRAAAQAVLQALGRLTDEEIDLQLHFAETGRIRRL